MGMFVSIATILRQVKHSNQGYSNANMTIQGLATTCFLGSTCIQTMLDAAMGLDPRVQALADAKSIDGACHPCELPSQLVTTC